MQLLVVTLENVLSILVTHAGLARVMNPSSAWKTTISYNWLVKYLQHVGSKPTDYMGLFQNPIQSDAQSKYLNVSIAAFRVP